MFAGLYTLPFQHFHHLPHIYMTHIYTIYIFFYEGQFFSMVPMYILKFHSLCILKRYLDFPRVTTWKRSGTFKKDQTNSKKWQKISCSSNRFPTLLCDKMRTHERNRPSAGHVVPISTEISCGYQQSFIKDSYLNICENFLKHVGPTLAPSDETSD